MAASNKRLMKASEVPEFVDAIIKAGCDICAIGHHGYVLGDVDLSPAEQEVVMPKVKKIEETYGDRDFPKAGDRRLPALDWPISGYRFVSDALVTKRNVQVKSIFFI